MCMREPLTSVMHIFYYENDKEMQNGDFRCNHRLIFIFLTNFTDDHAIIQHVLLRVQFVLSRKQYRSSLTSAILRVQFVISRKIADAKTLRIDSK